MRLAAARLGAVWKSHICPSEYAYIKMVISFRNKLLNKMIASLRTMFVNKMLICAHVNFLFKQIVSECAILSRIRTIFTRVTSRAEVCLRHRRELSGGTVVLRYRRERTVFYDK